MIRSSSTALIASFALIASLATGAAAAPTAWDNPSGSQASFDYQQGQNLNDRFGSPTPRADGFSFTPPQIVASATDVGHDEASDTLSVILNAKPNEFFTQIGANVLGDYAIFGFGSASTTATLRVTNLDTAATLTSPLAFGTPMPQTANNGLNNGKFEGLASIALPPAWSNIRVELDSFVVADSAFGSSYIQVKGADIDVETAQIPVPAGLAVAPLLGILAWKARRKFVR